VIFRGKLLSISIVLSQSLLFAMTTLFLIPSAFSQVVSENSVCFDNPQNFNNPTVYLWNPTPDNNDIDQLNWPGISLTQQGEFYCHDLGVSLESVNVIFSNNGAQQTGNLQFLGENRCRVNEQWETLTMCGLSADDPNEIPAETFTVYFKNNSNYAEPKLHYFDLVPSSPDSTWPGATMQPLGNLWYSYDFQVPISSGGVVFNDNGAAQTADLVLSPNTPCYQNGAFVALSECEYDPNPTLNYPNGRAIYFVNTPNWGTPNAYIWNEIPANSIPNSNWPGASLTEFGSQNLHFIEIANSTEQGKVIFNNAGADQTQDLDFMFPNLCYSDGVWMTLEQCGVPLQQQLIVGDDRKANRGTKLALTLPENPASGIPTWQSSAWTGELSGNSVVTPVLQTTGSFTVTVTLEGVTNQFILEVVSAIEALPERPKLAKPLNFPINGNVANGDYEFEVAFPNIADKFVSPVQVLNDGLNDLIYVVDKPGLIWVFPNDQNVEESQVKQILDIRDEVRDNHEQGFISMAFHPDFAQNGFAYIYFIEGENDEPSSGGRFDDGVLQRITLDSTSTPQGILAGSRVDVLRVPQVGNDHKGGKMEFHPGNDLFFMSIGDGAYAATAGDPVDPTDPRKNNSAQETDNLRGTFIRIEMLDTPVNGQYYRIPSDNPFVGNADVLDEIWSYGHRNPWRWSFQQTAPYTLWETEVGQAGFEEVNIIEPGKNYGWPICEGETHRGQAGGDPSVIRSCTNDLEGPVEGYFHSTGSVSIIGGVVYNGNALPALKGKFLFGDYISKNIWTLEEGQTKELLSDGFPSNIVSFGTDLSGDQVLVSTYGFEFGVSGIYRIVDRDAVAAVIPSKLSETGVFADISQQFPVSGVIEYQVNSQPWLDGALLRFFVTTPNDENISFSQEDLWSLPIGSAIIKHSDIKASATQLKPFETSVLFHQQNGWEAANYRWNSQGTDATLVTTTQVESVSEFINGSMQLVDRTVRAGSECSSCHSGANGKVPRGFKTQQLNRQFSQQGVSENQLDVFNRINLFNDAISASSNYSAYVDPTDNSADLNERARVYLDTNCSSCHAGSLMNLKYGVALQDMDIMNRRLAGSQYRMLPFDHTRSVLHSFQVSDGNRMPRGTTTTNPNADDLFKQWIDANDAVVVDQKIESSISTQNVRAGEAFELQIVRSYNNGFEEREYSAASSIFWASSNAAIINVAGLSEGNIIVTPQAAGQTTITATVNGVSTILTINVTGSVVAPTSFVATGLSSSSISLTWASAEAGSSYVLKRSNSSSGPFIDIANLPASSTNFVDTGLSPSTRYYYQVQAINSVGTSSAVTAFADTSTSTTIDLLRIETGNVFQLLANESRQLIALSESDGRMAGVSSSANWSSSDVNVLSVSTSGLVRGGIQAGTATITASFGGESGSVELVNQGIGTYLYFNNQDTNWGDVRAYVFATSNGNETPQTGAWPGVAMEPSVEYGGKWLRLALTSSQFGQQQTEVVFNCGGAACKTDDLQINTATNSQWFDNGQWLGAEPSGGGAVFVGTQLIINNGQVTWANNGNNLSGRLLTPGAVVDLNANQVGIGQTFRQWEGSAAPYIINPSSPNTKLLIPSALSLTINGVFDTVVDSFANGREYYRSAQAACVGCHGIDGEGSPPITNLANKYTFSELSNYIASNMPLGNPSACVGDCASEIASMLLAESFTAPAGVCDFTDLNDMVPPDRSNRLLTLYEYNNSVRDILNLSNDVDVTTGNLPATIPINGFKTAADTVFTEEYAQGYVNAAASVADLIGDDLLSLAPSCSDDLVCAIETVGKKVFRRPLSTNEVDELNGVHQTSGERGVIISLFSSPAMLYRSEVGEQITAGPQQGYFQLNSYEVASMLSFTYWGTTPNAWLMGLADSNNLTTAEQIRDALEQMLNDSRSEVALERFIEGWMDLEKEIGTRSLSDDLKADMKEETLRFVKTVFFNDGSYSDLMTANYSYMTQRLANHYGLPWPGGNNWQQVFYSGDNSERSGVLGHASVLTIQSAQEKTHPVKRGLFVRKNLMCQEFPPPPLGAALDPESDPSKGVRYRFETAHAQPGCDTCHQYIDGIGFGLESYNSFGQFVRTELTEDGTELPIDASGYIGSLDSAETFLSNDSPVFNYQGLNQLSTLIAASDHGKSCFARQWFRYANGRRESSEDSCTVLGFSDDFKEQSSVTLKDLVIEFTQTPNYTLRK
jgi:glucose/arabinose dehydrogenase/mono/diheme cytochrome c family protein